MNPSDFFMKLLQEKDEDTPFNAANYDKNLRAGVEE